MTVQPRRIALLLALLLPLTVAADPPPLKYSPQELLQAGAGKPPAPAPAGKAPAKAPKVTLKVRPVRRPGPPISWVRRPRAAQPAPKPTLGPRRAVGWGSGETLTYAVKLAEIQAGRAAISVGRQRRRGGKAVLKLRGLGETVPFIATFANMREEVVTEVDLAGMLPLRSIIDRKTGKRAKDRWMDTRFGVLVEQHIKRSGRKLHRKRRIAGAVFDPISALFALRSTPLRKGDRFRLLVLNGNSLYDVKLKVVGKERIYTRKGPRDAIRIDGLGRRVHDDGRRPVPGKKPRSLSLWLGTGRARVPLRLRGDTKLGSIEASVTSHRPARSGLRVRVARAR